MTNRMPPDGEPESEALPDEAQDPHCGDETQEMRGLSVQEIERLLKSDKPAK